MILILRAVPAGVSIIQMLGQYSRTIDIVPTRGSAVGIEQQTTRSLFPGLILEVV